MSIPKALRTATPVEGHGYAATYADLLVVVPGELVADRPYRRGARRGALYMAKHCGDCIAHNRYRARLSRMRTAYGRRSR